MASYTYTQLYGSGSIGEEISGLKTFTFINPSGSSYFTMETIPSPSGFYEASSPKNFIGTYVVSESMGLVTSSYIASIVVQPGTQSFTFEPDVLVTGSTYYLRGTGGYSLVISSAASAPVNTVAPVVTVTTPIQGDTLTTTDGTWTGTAPITFTYQWYNDTGLLSGETANTYVAQSTDVGFFVYCEVTGTNAVGSDLANSNTLLIYDTDYYNIYDGYAGTACSEEQSVLQNQLMIDLKAAGVWAKLDYFNVFATDGDSGFSTINWVTNTDNTSLGQQVTFTANQGWTFPNDEFEFIDTGFQVNSGTNYLKDDASRYYFPYAFGASGGTLDCLGDGNGDNNRLEIGNFNTQTINSTNTASDALDITSTVEAKSIHRINPSTIRGGNGTALSPTNTQTTQPLTSFTQIIGADNAVLGSDNTVAGYAMGASMIAENIDFVTAFDNYLNHL